MSKEAYLSSFSMGYGDDGILRIRIKEGTHVDLENIRLQYKTIESLVGDKKVPVLLDVREGFTTSKEAHEYLAERSSHRVATAVLTNNAITRAIINSYITIFRPAAPYKLFNDEAKAIEWLKEMTLKNH